MTTTEKAKLLGDLRRYCRTTMTAKVAAKIPAAHERAWWIIAGMIGAAADIAKQTGNIETLMQAVAAATGAQVQKIDATPAPANEGRMGIVPDARPRQDIAAAMMEHSPSIDVCPECQRYGGKHFSWCRKTESFSKDEVTS